MKYHNNIKASQVIKDCGQWVVTDYGLESNDKLHYYKIPKYRLGNDWDSHMDGKIWTNMLSFHHAIWFARKHFKIELTKEWR